MYMFVRYTQVFVYHRVVNSKREPDILIVIEQKHLDYFQLSKKIGRKVGG